MYKFEVPTNSPWFSDDSHWPEEVPKTLEIPAKPLDSLLKETAMRWPFQKAAWFEGTTINYAKYDRMVDSFATALHQLGVKKGDTVAIMLPNSIQYMVAFFAIVRIGAIVSGVNPTYKPLEVKHQLKIVKAKYLIFLDILFEEKIKSIEKELNLKALIGTNIGDFIPFLKRKAGLLLKKIPFAPLPPNILSFKTMLKTFPNPPDIEIDPKKDPAVYLMTGGTTGVPKAAALSHQNVYANALQIRLWFYKAKKGIANLGILPFFHAFGMSAVLIATITWGGWLILFPRPPKPAALIKTLKNVAPNKATVYVGVEVLFQKMADYLAKNPSKILSKKLMFGISGAGPLHRHVQEAFEKLANVPLVEGYGLTEASPVVCANLLWGPDEFRKSGSIGYPLTGTKYKIVDRNNPSKNLGIASGPEDDEHIGELAVCGPQIMMGYVDKPEETNATIVELEGEKWLLTGDIGYMNKRGIVAIMDRKKELIKYKGYSVFPKDVENLIAQNEHVSEVAVAGLPDKETNEAIKAWIVLKEESKGKITEEEFKNWCKENLTHYKVPKYVEFIDEIPKNQVGKVLRRLLVEADPVIKDLIENNS